MPDAVGESANHSHSLPILVARAAPAYTISAAVAWNFVAPPGTFCAWIVCAFQKGRTDYAPWLTGMFLWQLNYAVSVMRKGLFYDPLIRVEHA